MTNHEIVEKNLKLIRTCVSYQFKNKPKEFLEDYFHDLIVELLEYDNEKMNNAENEGHFNALVTKFIRNSVYSKTSKFYRRYVRWDRQTDEISEREKRIPDGD